MTEIKLPELGEGIETATVACWHVKLGDKVLADQEIVELVTDKATFNVAATREGILKEMCFDEGQEAAIGSVLARIEGQES